MNKIDKDLVYLLIVKAIEQNKNEEANEMLRIILRATKEEKHRRKIDSFIQLDKQDSEVFRRMSSMDEKLLVFSND